MTRLRQCSSTIFLKSRRPPAEVRSCKTLLNAVNPAPAGGALLSASRNRLPARVALGYVGVVARRVGTVIPALRGLAGVVVARVIRSVRIIRPSQPVTPPPSIAPSTPAMVPVDAAAATETTVE